MQVILVEDVKDLGKEGQIVKVAEGYARNLLLPSGKAMQATPGNLALWEKRKDQMRAKAAKDRAELAELAERIEKKAVIIRHKVGANEKLYGSVTATDIAAGLAERGIEVDRKRIQLPDPIKTLGEFSVPIKLSAEVTANARVQIVAAS